ncbi:MAG: iron-sulfur cluster assembly accessory protein [Ignavibacteria bacterium]|nr:iron-sulfur cluster assembly accessory protein [Ignavibacteria bacterium]MBT8383638.1 iron-sulfur cluster assembly accessory protein [Ignavibacteria bacterium]MBT8393166.1 iron-sulfur cluster assembly accessory protein [Ignavibacteria bacterium]NNJ53775.1 iron-sulfur cluster assembly accessory protein [Ignavibacteriaceae bacterium]NNL21278.1 iron-sulfur cluster assembly accessory protein [Ignavibacteriaceae bacterium]
MAEVKEKTDITVTEKAHKEIRRIMQENNIPYTYGLRVGVKGGGCSGLTYTLNFDEASKEGDSVIESNDVKLFIDGKSLFYLLGTELDFSAGLNGKGFKFHNPNATKSCGCGDSFGV